MTSMQQKIMSSRNKVEFGLYPNSNNYALCFPTLKCPHCPQNLNILDRLEDHHIQMRL